MKDTELRIGNWISLPLIGNTQLSGRDIAELDALGAVQPIPLTPEILEKCGFELNGFKEWEIMLPDKEYSCVQKKLYFAGDYLYLEEWPEGIPPQERAIVTIWNKDLMKTFYLHQLQNLYFSLTGQELNVKI